MIAAISAFFGNFFTKVYGYVILAGLIVGAFLTTYLKGRSDMADKARRESLETDLANRVEADQVRADVGVAPTSDIDERLRRWQRPGN